MCVLLQEGTFAYRNNSGGLGVLSGVPAPLLSCTRQGQLPGCLFMFDDPYDQCSDGRTGTVIVYLIKSYLGNPALVYLCPNLCPEVVHCLPEFIQHLLYPMHL